MTKHRAFNKAMITPFTEVIFIDELDESALDIADWKILTQGGYTKIPNSESVHASNSIA